MAGRILTLQRQARELGRLRSGYTDTSGPKAKPVRSGTWIVTSHSEDYVQAAAQLYGGKPEQWQPLGNGAKQWRVITDAPAIDAIMPPGDPLSQSLEMWNRGGCARRCDGITEQLSDSPCLCRKEFGDDFHLMAKDRRCNMTSRLNVILPDMPDVGVFRIETHSYWAANEMAATVDVIRGATGGDVMVPIRARIEPRTRVAEGKTKQYPVIVIELRGATAGAILGGQREFAGIASGAQRAAIESGPAQPAADVPDYVTQAKACAYFEDVQDLWNNAKQAGHLTDELSDQLIALAGEKPARPGGSTKPEAPAASDEDPDEVWMLVVAAAPEGWTTSDLERDFAAKNEGLPPSEASAADLRAYLREIKGAAA